jgi:hypothetical protein
LSPVPASGVPSGLEGMVRHPLRAALGVVAVVALALGLEACVRGEDDRNVPPSPRRSATQPPEAGRCGGQLGTEGRSAALSLTGSFPARVQATHPTFEGRVTVVNRSESRVEVLSASAPDVYLTRSRKIVATPLVRDLVGRQLVLAPGAVREFTAEGSLRGCSDGRPLPPGRYEINAVLVIVGTDGTGVREAVGGPWSLEIT